MNQKPMSDSEVRETLEGGFSLLFSHGAVIAMLPIEDWLQAIEHAEAVGPILDPTLYREYLGSPKPEILKDVLQAALPLKTAILKAQKIAREKGLA